MLCPFALVAQNTWRSWHLPSPQQTALQKFFPEISAQCRKKHVARKNKGYKIQKKQNFGQGKLKQRFCTLQNKFAFCKNLRQVAKRCFSHLTACAVLKETFFPLQPIAKQSCFCNKPATSCNKLQNAVFCTSPLVTVANIFTSVVCVRLVVIFTDAKLCLPNLPKRNSSRQG